MSTPGEIFGSLGALHSIATLAGGVFCFSGTHESTKRRKLWFTFPIALRATVALSKRKYVVMLHNKFA